MKKCLIELWNVLLNLEICYYKHHKKNLAIDNIIIVIK